MSPFPCFSLRNGLFFRLIRDCGAQAAIDCMSRIAKLTSRWLMNRGFTIGIDDVNAEYGLGGGVNGVGRTVLRWSLRKSKLFSFSR